MGCMRYRQMNCLICFFKYVCGSEDFFPLFLFSFMFFISVFIICFSTSFFLSLLLLLLSLSFCLSLLFSLSIFLSFSSLSHSLSLSPIGCSRGSGVSDSIWSGRWQTSGSGSGSGSRTAATTATATGGAIIPTDAIPSRDNVSSHVLLQSGRKSTTAST